MDRSGRRPDPMARTAPSENLMKPRPPSAHCTPLDVEDAGSIATTPLPKTAVDDALRAALSSPHFDGPSILPSPSERAGRGVVVAARTVAKVAHWQHERLESVQWLAGLGDTLEVRTPAVLDAGVVGTDAGPVWWTVCSRLVGTVEPGPTPERQREVGKILRRWHDRVAVPVGLHIDDPGGLGVLLGTARALKPTTFHFLAAALDEVCAGLPVVAIHGDFAVGKNTVFSGNRLVGVLDPGAVHAAPAMLDLAWAYAVDSPRGGRLAPLLEGYGQDGVEVAHLEALIPLLLLRRWVDLSHRPDKHEARALSDEIVVRDGSLRPFVVT